MRLKAILALVGLSLSHQALSADLRPPRVEHNLTVKKHPIAGVHVAGAQVGLNGVAISGQGVRPWFAYFPKRSLGINVGYLNLTNNRGVALVSGFDVNAQWFAFSPGATTTFSGSNDVIESYTTLSHFFLLGYSSRTANFDVLQVGFSGFKAGYGLNWAIGKALGYNALRPFLLSFELNREFLSSSTSNTLQVTTVSGGLGLEL